VIVASGTVMSYDLPLCHFHKTAKTGTRARQGGPQTFLVLYLAFSFQAVTHITDVPQGAEFTVSIEANFQFYTTLVVCRVRRTAHDTCARPTLA
jgi:hypothetical protein